MAAFDPKRTFRTGKGLRVCNSFLSLRVVAAGEAAPLLREGRDLYARLFAPFAGRYTRIPVKNSREMRCVSEAAFHRNFDYRQIRTTKQPLRNFDAQAIEPLEWGQSRRISKGPSEMFSRNSAFIGNLPHRLLSIQVIA